MARDAAMAVSGLALFAGLAIPAAAPRADDTGAIEEIVVTAEKKAEKAQDVPISIGVVGSQDIQQQGIINANDLGGKIANLTIELPFGPQEPQFSIRGVTETDYNQNQSSPIAMYVDGDFKSIGTLQQSQLFDIDRIEVERGPQGTFQGRNATGGAINIYTNRPSLSEFDGQVMVGVGNYGRYETQGFINVPVNDVLAVRGAWTFTNVDGYFKNLAPDAPYGGNLSGVYDFGGRISAYYRPSDDFDATLRIGGTRSEPVNYGVYPLNIKPGGIGLTPGSLGPASWGYTYIPSTVSPGNYDIVPNSAYHTALYNGQPYTAAGVGYDQNIAGTSDWPVHRRNADNATVQLEMNYQVTPELKLTSVTGYDKGSWYTNEIDDGSPVDVDKAQYSNHVHSIQEELRLVSSFDGPYNFVLGALYDRETLWDSVHNVFNTYQPAIVPGLVVTATGVPVLGGNGKQLTEPVNICVWFGAACIEDNSFNQTRMDHAVYLNNTYKILPDLQLQLGARYTDDSVGVQNYTGGYTWLQYPYGPVVPEVPAYTFPNSTTSDHKWLGKVGLDYHITPDNMVYGSWSLGFRGSAYDAEAFFSPPNAVKPETLIDYEVGSKNQFLDHHLEINADAFYYIYRNQQYASYTPQGLSIEINLPKIHSYGFELETVARPLPNLRVNFSGGYTYSIYEGGVVDAYNGFDNISGYNVELSPRWSYAINVDWRILEIDAGRLDLYVNANGQTREFFDAVQSPDATQNGFSLFGARLTASNPDDTIELSAWVANLFDRHYLTSVYDTSLTWNYSYSQRGIPRTFGLQATYKFGGPSESPPEEAPPAPPPPAPPAPPPAPVVEQKRSFQVFFDFDKSNITAAAAKTIQAASDAIKAGNVVQITVTGHTDTVGSAAYNQGLSERRAASVKAELVHDGIAGGEITTIGVGKTGLLVPTADGVREPQNRRAEIVLQ
jgi:iron complex outermembrane receptor protein